MVTEIRSMDVILKNMVPSNKQQTRRRREWAVLPVHWQRSSPERNASYNAAYNIPMKMQTFFQFKCGIFSDELWRTDTQHHCGFTT